MPALAAQYAVFLAAHTPRWRDFCIAPYGIYLGFAIGPSSAGAIWAKAFAK